MNRSGLIMIGFAVAVVGYAVLYSGISDLNPCITPTGEPFGTFTALTTGASTLLSSATPAGTPAPAPPTPPAFRRRKHPAKAAA